jgi:hypothetical protein
VQPLRAQVCGAFFSDDPAGAEFDRVRLKRRRQFVQRRPTESDSLGVLADAPAGSCRLSGSHLSARTMTYAGEHYPPSRRGRLRFFATQLNAFVVVALGSLRARGLLTKRLVVSTDQNHNNDDAAEPG